MRIKNFMLGKIINVSNTQVLFYLKIHTINWEAFDTTEKIMIKRGELYYADLSPVIGSEQGGVRPILIVQNDTGNKYSPTIIAAAVTSQLGKAKLPTHIELSANEFGLMKDSVILLEQIRTLDKKRLKEKIGELSTSKMQKVNTALLISLGFADKLDSFLS